MNKKPSALMFQGTCSNAGKSLITAAYCRILSNRGLKVMPFKAQNMSLNSAVTADGKEVGRAQALQARAARVPLSSDMNPVLLKPYSNNGSQVIVNGEVWKNLEALDYYDSRKYLWSQITAAYDRLAAEADVIVLEGAGSPGEVNLKSRDMVNMAMARYAESSVILVGDIDRGGLYASFIGHYTVMDSWERELLKGFLVNKFRGDATLLEDAHQYMLDHTGIPVMGVVPYVRDHRLPEEDGVDFEKRYGGNAEGILKIGVLQLPHIANSTDLDPLQDWKSCSLQLVNEPEDLPGLHLLIIPGSKNVISDLRWLKKQGLQVPLIRQFRQSGLHLLGICGGFQMLGESLEDPLGVEGPEGNRENGLGLLPGKTVIRKDKTLKQTLSRCRISFSEVEGYEIHHGETLGGQEWFDQPGLGTWDKQVWGTYLHGILDNRILTSYLLHETARAHGLSIEEPSQGEGLNLAIDRFAGVLEESADMDFLLKQTGL